MLLFATGWFYYSARKIGRTHARPALQSSIAISGLATTVMVVAAVAAVAVAAAVGFIS